MADPKVPDDIVERMRQVTITQAWGVVRGEGTNTNLRATGSSTHPGGTLCGRAVTAMYMPRRPVMRRIMDEKGEHTGQVGDQISWPIDALVQGDVYVADVFGKIEQGPVIGDNLATAIYANSGNGVVHDALSRARSGRHRRVRRLHKLCSRLGSVLCLADHNAIGYELSHPHWTRDLHAGRHRFGQTRGRSFHTATFGRKSCHDLRSSPPARHVRQAASKRRTYTPGQIDRRWSDDMKQTSRWLEDHINELPVPKEAIQELLKERTW